MKTSHLNSGDTKQLKQCASNKPKSGLKQFLKTTLMSVREQFQVLKNPRMGVLKVWTIVQMKTRLQKNPVWTTCHLLLIACYIYCPTVKIQRGAGLTRLYSVTSMCYGSLLLYKQICCPGFCLSGNIWAALPSWRSLLGLYAACKKDCRQFSGKLWK